MLAKKINDLKNLSKISARALAESSTSEKSSKTKQSTYKKVNQVAGLFIERIDTFGSQKVASLGNGVADTMNIISGYALGDYRVDDYILLYNKKTDKLLELVCRKAGT